MSIFGPCQIQVGPLWNTFFSPKCQMVELEITGRLLVARKKFYNLSKKKFYNLSKTSFTICPEIFFLQFVFPSILVLHFRQQQQRGLVITLKLLELELNVQCIHGLPTWTTKVQLIPAEHNPSQQTNSKFRIIITKLIWIPINPISKVLHYYQTIRHYRWQNRNIQLCIFGGGCERGSIALKNVC